MESSQGSPHQRRFFLTSLLGGIAAVLAGAFGWPIWRYLSPKPEAGPESKVSIPRAQVEVGGAHFFNFRGQPAVLLQPSSGQFRAFSAVCTHLGCIVQWQAEKNQFLCPCHAGIFSTTGEVLSGPPPKPLPSLPVNLSGEQVLIG